MTSAHLPCYEISRIPCFKILRTLLVALCDCFGWFLFQLCSRKCYSFQLVRIEMYGSPAVLYYKKPYSCNRRILEHSQVLLCLYLCLSQLQVSAVQCMLAYCCLEVKYCYINAPCMFENYFEKYFGTEKLFFCPQNK